MNKPTIKVNPIKAAKQNVAGILFITAFIGYYINVNFVSNSMCTTILGINSAFLNIILITYIIPAFGLLVALTVANIGYKQIRYGYSPPLGTYTFFREKKAKTGKWVKISGYFLIATPLVFVYLVYLGNYIYTEVFGDFNYNELIKIIEQKCKNNA